MRNPSPLLEGAYAYERDLIKVSLRTIAKFIDTIIIII